MKTILDSIGKPLNKGDYLLYTTSGNDGISVAKIIGFSDNEKWINLVQQDSYNDKVYTTRIATHRTKYSAFVINNPQESITDKLYKVLENYNEFI